MYVSYSSRYYYYYSVHNSLRFTAVAWQENTTRATTARIENGFCTYSKRLRLINIDNNLWIARPKIMYTMISPVKCLKKICSIVGIQNEINEKKIHNCRRVYRLPTLNALPLPLYCINSVK